MITPSHAVIDVRVPASARDAGGAASASGWLTHVAAKPSGRSEATCVSQPIDQNLRIRKRTFRRAVARAARTGGAYYKGRWRSAQHFGVPVAASDTLHETASTRPLRTPKHPSPDAPPLPKHLKILTWNAGGLGGQTGALFDELQVYANSRPFDILFVQESRWTFSNTWEDPRWFFVHSGSSERDFKQGGVLILVAKRIVDPGSLRFVEPLPGRILWVHFTYRGRPVDLLNFYQHTWRNSERVAQLRHRALDLLTKSVQTISLRSVLIAAGDFNAQCVQQMPHVGPKVMQHTHWAQDSGEFQSFLEGNDLVALNTFSSLPNSHDHFTYAWGSQKSQLDYILLRRAHATGPSKQARVHYTFPLIGIRDGGRHYPVCTQVPMAWQPWQHSRGQPPPPQIDRHAIADALAGTPDASVSAFRTAVQSLMQTPGLTLDAMQHQVHHFAVEHFPVRRAPEATKSCQDIQLQGYAARMWSHFHAYRKLRSLSSGATLSVLFRAWHHRALYHSMRAAAKKRSAELRKLRRDRLFATARTAATSGNLREFYKVVRLLVPQGSKRRFQLCQGGAPLPPERELAIMQKHFEEQFASHNV